MGGEGCHILHLHNDTLLSRVPGRQDRLLPVGPVSVRLRAPGSGAATARVDMRVAETEVSAARDADGCIVFEVATILDHEVAVVTWLPA